MIIDEILRDLGNDSDNDRTRVSEEELEAQKVDPKGVELPLIAFSRREIPGIKLPEVRPPFADRGGRRLARDEQRRQWQIKQKFLRTVATNESILAVNQRALLLLDRAQEIMTDVLYGRKRRESMNEFMAQVTAQLLQLTHSEVMAVAESYLRRISEDL